MPPPDILIDDPDPEMERRVRQATLERTIVLSAEVESMRRDRAELERLQRQLGLGGVDRRDLARSIFHTVLGLIRERDKLQADAKPPPEIEKATRAQRTAEADARKAREERDLMAETTAAAVTYLRQDLLGELSPRQQAGLPDLRAALDAVFHPWKKTRINGKEPAPAPGSLAEALVTFEALDLSELQHRFVFFRDVAQLLYRGIEELALVLRVPAYPPDPGNAPATADRAAPVQLLGLIRAEALALVGRYQDLRVRAGLAPAPTPHPPTEVAP